MSKNQPEIMVYITTNRERVISGAPLTLFIEDENEKKVCIQDLELALRANVVQLKNGDYMLISK